MFEHHRQPVAPLPVFIGRLIRALLLGVVIVGVSLFLGVLGYRTLEGMSWVDSLLNASMILGGMGPANVLKSNSGKIFASVYALYSGLVLITIAGILLGPIVHRVLHVFHRASFEDDS